MYCVFFFFFLKLLFFSFAATLFKCEVRRPDCSRCVSMKTTRPELGCGWCSESNLCAVKDHPECGDINFWIREMSDADNEVIAKNCPAPKFSVSDITSYLVRPFFIFCTK